MQLPERRFVVQMARNWLEANVALLTELSTRNRIGLNVSTGHVLGPGYEL